MDRDCWGHLPFNEAACFALGIDPITLAASDHQNPMAYLHEGLRPIEADVLANEKQRAELVKEKQQLAELIEAHVVKHSDDNDDGVAPSRARDQQWQKLINDFERADLLTYAVERDLSESRKDLAARRAQIENRVEVYEKLCGEVAKIRAGRESTLILIADDTDQPGYEGAVIDASSLRRWLHDHGLVKTNQGEPQDRAGATEGVWLPYTTPLIEAMKHLMEEHWVNYDPQRPPTNDAITRSIELERDDAAKEGTKSKYPPERELSGVVLKGLVKMIRRPKPEA